MLLFISTYMANSIVQKFTVIGESYFSYPSISFIFNAITPLHYNKMQLLYASETVLIWNFQAFFGQILIIFWFFDGVYQVECPKYIGFCMTRQKKDYPFIEMFHSPAQVSFVGFNRSFTRFTYAWHEFHLISIYVSS